VLFSPEAATDERMADLFSEPAAWMEIGARGRYEGREHTRAFLLRVLGDGRWGLLKDEVINHVQQLLITVDEDRQRARARSSPTIGWAAQLGGA
jgi:hypothetical protein